MKISVVIDTNFLFVSKIKDFTNLKFMCNLERLINVVIENNLIDIVTIAIPRVVVKEVIQQQCEQYYDNIGRLNSMKFPNIDIKVVDEYASILERKFKYELNLLTNDKKVKIKILEYPSEKNFHSTIERAIEKKPPFEGVEKQSDKGFKDAILWQSLIEYKNSNKDELITLLTRDKIFSDKELISEYKRLFNQDITIIESEKKEETIKKLVNIIMKLTNLKLNETYEEKIYKKFKNTVINSNFNLLYKGVSYESFRTGSTYTFNKLEIVDFNFLGMNEYIENGIAINYFVVEMRVILTFQDNIPDLATQEVFSDYWEYEVDYCKKDDTFTIIGRDSFADEAIEDVNKKLKIEKLER